MSKYVKYISSSHYGAPPLKGDRYGYFVELLRSCLCTGFNANDSIISIETIDLINKKISITFNDPHTYSVDQTLLIENIQDFQFNGEYEIINNQCQIDHLFIDERYDAVLFDRDSNIESKTLSDRIPEIKIV